MHVNILLIEDDPDMRDALSVLLELQGYRVATAANGLEGLERLREMGRPCLILLDLMMPVMDGWSFRGELLKCRDFADVPVVILSGVDDADEEARRLQCADHLSKPFPPERLYRVVQSYC